MENLDFRLKKIDETGIFFLEEIKDNELIRKKHKKVCKVINYFQNFIIIISGVNGCVSISAFASLVGIPIGITSSAVGIKFVQSVQELKSISQSSRIKKKASSQ